MHITVDILSDTICPWCYIGKRRIEEALAAVAPEVEVTADLRWHPFQLNPDMPPDGISRKRYIALKFGGAERGRTVYQNIEKAAQSSGLELNFDRIARTPNTVDSHRLLVFAQRAGVQNDVVERLFSAYFREGQDIGNIDALAEIGEAAGLGREKTERYLQGDTDRAEVIDSDARARQAGASGVPHFVIDGELAVAGAQEPQVFRNVFAVIHARAQRHA